MSSAALTEQEDAAALLRALLEQPGHCRDRWLERAEKRRQGEISQAAVARVIADHLKLESTASNPAFRRLRARVSRALSGQNLTIETITMFVSAFSISERDEKILQSALKSAGSKDLSRRNYKITSLRESHFLDAQGRPSRHRLSQDIVALADGVDRIPVKWDTRSLTIVEASGEVSDVYAQDDGMYAFDIMLSKPLLAGERASVSYTVKFGHEHPQDEFRRHALQEIENASVEIHFDPHSIPSEVWWASWSSGLPGSRPITKERMFFERREGIVNKSIAFAADCFVGFFWTWHIGSNHD